MKNNTEKVIVSFYVKTAVTNPGDNTLHEVIQERIVREVTETWVTENVLAMDTDTVEFRVPLANIVGEITIIPEE